MASVSDSQVKKMMDYIDSPSTRNVRRAINPNRTGPWAPKWKRAKHEGDETRDRLIEAIIYEVSKDSLKKLKSSQAKLKERYKRASVEKTFPRKDK